MHVCTSGGYTSRRTRTVRAVTESELCYLLKDDVQALYEPYPELRARLARFSGAARVVNDRLMAKVDLTRDQLQVRVWSTGASHRPEAANLLVTHTLCHNLQSCHCRSLLENSRRRTRRRV